MLRNAALDKGNETKAKEASEDGKEADTAQEPSAGRGVFSQVPDSQYKPDDKK